MPATERLEDILAKLPKRPEPPDYSPPLPAVYAVGSALTFRIHGDTELATAPSPQALIKHAFLPLTKSQVFRVRLASSVNELPVDFPATAILKLYDRRYVNDREDRAWSPEVEAATRLAWKQKRSDLIQDVDSYWDGPPLDELDDAAAEDYFWWMQQIRFKQEKEAYRRLLPLQGRFIPRCYGAIQLEPSDDDRLVPEAAIYGLLLEDVGGVTLEEFDTGAHDLVCAGHALLAALSAFPSYGVLHRDIRSGNVLVCLSAQSPLNKLVLVDLGEAWLKGGEVGLPDDEFKDGMEMSDEVGALRYVLNRRRIRAHTPHDTRNFTAGRTSPLHSGNNLYLRHFPSPNDVRRWYDKLPREPDDPEPDPFKSKREIWRTKPAVLDWIAKRPEGVEAFYVPRPGSPEEHVVPPEFRVAPA